MRPLNNSIISQVALKHHLQVLNIPYFRCVISCTLKIWTKSECKEQINSVFDALITSPYHLLHKIVETLYNTRESRLMTTLPPNCIPPPFLRNCWIYWICRALHSVKSNHPLVNAKISSVNRMYVAFSSSVNLLQWNSPVLINSFF